MGRGQNRIMSESQNGTVQNLVCAQFKPLIAKQAHFDMPLSQIIHVGPYRQTGARISRIRAVAACIYDHGCLYARYITPRTVRPTVIHDQQTEQNRKMSALDDGSWRTPTFRQSVVAKM